jgi:hypothetical protein
VVSPKDTGWEGPGLHPVLERFWDEIEEHDCIHEVPPFTESRESTEAVWVGAPPTCIRDVTALLRFAIE